MWEMFAFFLTVIKGESSDVFVLLGESVHVAHSLGPFVTLAQNQIYIDDLTGLTLRKHIHSQGEMEKHIRQQT